MGNDFNILSNVQRLRNQLSWRARWCFPNLVSRFTSDRESYFLLDRAENAETLPGQDEEARVEVFWAAEFYGPSEADALCESLDKLQWRAGLGFPRRESAADWVRRQREYGRGNAWYNIGIVADSKDGREFILTHNKMDLPKEVRFLKVDIHHFTPAITCVVVAFVLNESLKDVYFCGLKKEYKGRFFRGRRVISRRGPRDLKREAVEGARSKFKEMAKVWFGKTMPGYFCGVSADAMPTAELVVTKLEPLFLGRGAPFESWQDLVFNVRPTEVWYKLSKGGLKFTLGQGGVRREGVHLISSICEAETESQDYKHYGEGGRKYVNYAVEVFSDVLANYSVVGYLTENLKALKLSRSSLRLSRISKVKQLRVLEDIQKFFDQSLGAPVIASELKRRASHSSNFLYRYGDYGAPSRGSKKDLRSLRQFFAQATDHYSDTILVEEHSIREHFDQVANIISIRESVHAQKKTQVLTVLALLVAVLSMGITALQSRSWVEELKLLLTSIVPFI